MLFRLIVFSWWPLLLCSLLNCRITWWDFQTLSWKVMIKSKWLYVILDISFMSLTILNIIVFVIFLVFNICFNSSSNIFVQKHQFNIIYHILNNFFDNYLFHIVTSIPLAQSSHKCHLCLHYFCQHKLLGFAYQKHIFSKCLWSLRLSSRNSKVIHCSKWHSLKHVQRIKSCPLLRVCTMLGNKLT